MKHLYLLYSADGFLKKFPLDKSLVKIGRDESNDLEIDDDFISRRHLDIHVKTDSILVEDAGSANGFFVGNEKKQNARISIDESFKTGDVIFTLKKGEPSEFSLSEHFHPEFVKATKSKYTAPPPAKTRSLETIYKEVEDDIFHKGLRFNTIDAFGSHLASKLAGIPGFGTLFLVEKENRDLNIRFSVNGDAETLAALKEIPQRHPRFFQHRITPEDSTEGDGTGNTHAFYSEPLDMENKNSALVYFPGKVRTESEKNIERLLFALSKGLSLLDNVIEKKKQLTENHADHKQEEIEIITNSEKMKDLIKQAKKIADSDIFILIEGESGTGKELFARLIHRYSKRDEDKFVALNCAAIPENLLESELFGYEKGAFTGAYKQKKGKLELASGGTLVLDEIGDMPLNLQSKLLRALQEHEFYRLGGAASIKVDLRIISLTHQNLEDLIREKQFREDLYYRLVHRTITIPPLRERKEDIPPLINFFTNKFCRRKDRAIGGYSMKAFESLVNFDWHGNIRQLENEINSIVNLTDEGETVDFDILSEKIRKQYGAGRPKTETPPSGYNRKPEREEIIETLKEHDWNKSKAARELNMTYHGLHKKMKKMGIEVPGSGGVVE